MIRIEKDGPHTHARGVPSGACHIMNARLMLKKPTLLPQQQKANWQKHIGRFIK